MDRTRFEQMDARLDEISERGWPDRPAPRGRHRATPSPERVEKRIESMRERVARAIADFDYYQASPLGWKHGTVIVWAGMRGVVTLAAAQTIPRSVEDRPVLIYIAFVVALVSLMLQGFTLPWLSNRLKLDAPGEGADDQAEQDRLDAELREAAASRALRHTLAELDADQLSIELRLQGDD